MHILKRIFQTRDQARDFYRNQLSKHIAFVESFDALPAGTAVSLALQIRESKQSIDLEAKVQRTVGKSEATTKGYGARAGLLLDVAIPPDNADSLQAFFMSGASEPSGSGLSAAVSQAVQSSPAQNISTAPEPIPPFANLSAMDATEVAAELDRFFALAQNVGLHRLFGLRENAQRHQIRTVFNAIVRSLHPDTYAAKLPRELCARLEQAYQFVNDAYQILQHPIESIIYMEISKQERAFSGMTLARYQQWLADYRQKNSNNIRLAENLVAQAEASRNGGDIEQARQNLRLALQYDPYCVPARSLTL
ncbi:MAG: hypothetical protein FWC40_08555 [Proteobacteria bacterium]|nr:hypothetical protein [Pseudomonadota bacterium]